MAPPYRTLLGGLFGRNKPEPPPTDNPVYNEFLKKKPPPRPEPVPGDLASSSIFESEDAGPTTKKKAGAPTAGGVRRRDPTVMAAVLDPRPHVRRRWERKMVIKDIRRRGRVTRKEWIKKNERESLSKSHFLKTSVKKLGPLARQIAGKTIEDALVQMRFSKKKAAWDVRKHLQHARNVAIVRRGMGLGKTTKEDAEPVQIVTKEGKRRKVTDRTGIYIEQAWVGRGPYGREPEYRARGQVNMLRPPVTSTFALPALGCALTWTRYLGALEGGSDADQRAPRARGEEAQQETLGAASEQAHQGTRTLLFVVAELMQNYSCVPHIILSNGAGCFLPLATVQMILPRQFVYIRHDLPRPSILSTLKSPNV